MSKNKKIIITTLTPDDWEVLRDLKLHSLEQEPIAFEDAEEGRTRYLERTEEEWRARLNPRQKDKVWWFVKDIDTNTYIGTAFVMIKEGVATIQHVYVDKTYRGQGIGKKILQTLIEELKERNDIVSIEIQVLETQTTAITLYHSLGFRDVKTIKKEAKRGNIHYDEIEMRLNLEMQESV